MDKMMREAAEFKMARVDDERADADADAPGVGPPASRPSASANIAAIMAMRTPSSDGGTPRARQKKRIRRSTDSAAPLGRKRERLASAVWTTLLSWRTATTTNGDPNAPVRLNR